MYINNELYKEIIDKTIVQTIDIVFFNDKNEILLLYRNNSPLKWIYYIPWWRRLKNETILESAKRKSLEELWINIKEDKLKFLWIYDDILNDSIYENISTHCSPITYLYNLSKDEEKSINLDGQHSDFKFFSINDSNLHFMVKIRINDIIKLNII
jgi:hypothetical protein